MSRISLVSSTALALTLALPAWAITPEEVWATWQASAVAAGQTISAKGEARSGDTLTVTGIVSTVTQPDGTVFSTTIDQAAFQDLGDATVQVTLSDTVPLTVSIPTFDGKLDVISVDMSQPGMTIIASGTPQATSYDVTSPTFVATLTDITMADGSEMDIAATATGTDLAGRYTVSPGAEGIMALESEGSIATIVIEASGTDPETPGNTFAFTVDLADLKSTLQGTLLASESMANLSAALAKGVAIVSNASVGAISYDLEVVDATGGGKFGGTFTGASFDIALDKTRLAYGLGVTGADLTAAGAELGIPPVASTFAELSFAFMLPILKSDTPQDFSFVTRFVDFTLNEEIWAMVDPGGQLNREPATVILDLNGTGAWAVDIMDPAVQNGTVPVPDIPGTLNTLDLTQLLLKGLGTEIAATGALTFDNADWAAFGMPTPTGKINVTLRGINALIDSLVSLGLVPEDDLMGVRLGLGMFTRPGAGPDELTSELEFKEGGFFANGQRLQ